MVGANEASVHTSYKNIESMGFLLNTALAEVCGQAPVSEEPGAEFISKVKGSKCITN